MTAALLFALQLLWTNATPGEVISGLATFMNPGKLERAAANNGYTLPPGVIDFAAMNRKGDKGRLIYIERDGRIHGPYLVVDCAQAGPHYETRERQGRIVEVSWTQAQAWSMDRPIPVRVWLTKPPDRIYQQEAF